MLINVNINYIAAGLKKIIEWQANCDLLYKGDGFEELTTRFIIIEQHTRLVHSLYTLCMFKRL